MADDTPTPPPASRIHPASPIVAGALLVLLMLQLGAGGLVVAQRKGWVQINTQGKAETTVPRPSEQPPLPLVTFPGERPAESNNAGSNAGSGAPVTTPFGQSLLDLPPPPPVEPAPVEPAPAPEVTPAPAPAPAPEVKPAPAPEVKPAPAPEVKPAPAPQPTPAPAPGEEHEEIKPNNGTKLFGAN